MFIIENRQFAEEQPYMTPTRNGYLEQLKQLSSKDLCRRSDITITSTLSMGIFPQDYRQILTYSLMDMKQEQLNQYIDEKRAF